MDVLIPDFSNNIPQLEFASQIKEIIRHIDLFEWNLAREIWILDVMRYNLSNRRTHQDREINLLNSERENFLEPIRDFQLYDTEQNCTPGCPLNKMLISNNSYVMLLSWKRERQKRTGKKINVEIRNLHEGICDGCNAPIEAIKKFHNNPNFIYFDSVDEIFVEDIPLNINIDGKSYNHLCSTVYKNRHFKGIFRLENNFFVVDDIGRSVRHLQDELELKTKRWRKTISLYYLI